MTHFIAPGSAPFPWRTGSMLPTMQWYRHWSTQWTHPLCPNPVASPPNLVKSQCYMSTRTTRLSCATTRTCKFRLAAVDNSGYEAGLPSPRAWTLQSWSSLPQPQPRPFITVLRLKWPPFVYYVVHGWIFNLISYILSFCTYGVYMWTQFVNICSWCYKAARTRDCRDGNLDICHLLPLPSFGRGRSVNVSSWVVIRWIFLVLIMLPVRNVSVCE